MLCALKYVQKQRLGLKRMQSARDKSSGLPSVRGILQKHLVMCQMMLQDVAP